MAEEVIKSPLQYFDKASSSLREMGLMPEKVEPSPITALLEKISDLDQGKIALIARTLGQAEVFNEVERGTNRWMKTSRGDIAERFDKIRNSYLSVTKETKNQIEREGKILDAYRDYRGALKHAEVMALATRPTADATLRQYSRRSSTVS